MFDPFLLLKLALGIPLFFSAFMSVIYFLNGNYPIKEEIQAFVIFYILSLIPWGTLMLIIGVL